MLKKESRTIAVRLVLNWCSLLVVFLGTDSVAVASSPSALARSALEQTKTKVTYDPSYKVIPYPMGDVATDKGVCTDVVVRALRTIGIDLQRLVHEDISHNFDVYPNLWMHKKPDRNIDHRRVPILLTYMERSSYFARVSDISIGDIAVWAKQGVPDHIGIVTDVKGMTVRYVHNFGKGPVVANNFDRDKLVGLFKLTGFKI